MCQKIDWVGDAICTLVSAKVSKSQFGDGLEVYADSHGMAHAKEFFVPLKCKDCGYTVMLSASAAIAAAQKDNTP
jgi:hypothetical protein